VVKNSNGSFSSNLTCETGARKRNLNLKIAHEDAKHWWETGKVPFRETPKLFEDQEAPYISFLPEDKQKEIRQKEREEYIEYLNSIIWRGDEEKNEK
jgi:hypothetical protein